MATTKRAAGKPGGWRMLAWAGVLGAAAAGPAWADDGKDGKKAEGAPATTLEAQGLPELKSRNVLRKIVRRTPQGGSNIDLSAIGKKDSKLRNVQVLSTRLFLNDESTGKLTAANLTSEFRVGQQFWVEVECATDCYVYIFSQKQGGKEEYALLLPDPGFDKTPHVKVEKDKPKRLPADGESCFEFTPPAGEEKLFLFVSPTPIEKLTFKEFKDEVEKNQALGSAIKQVKVDLGLKSRGGSQFWAAAAPDDKGGGEVGTDIVGSTTDEVPSIYKEVTLKTVDR